VLNKYKNKGMRRDSREQIKNSNPDTIDGNENASVSIQRMFRPSSWVLRYASETK
jgi:hypothetical protein